MALLKYFNRTGMGSDIANGIVAKRICQLKPVDPNYKVIHLTPGKNSVGRCKETGIKDTKCSKTQLEFDVDMSRSEIKMKVVGMNPSGVNGFMVLQNSVCEIIDGDVLELVYGKHPFTLVYRTILEKEIIQKESQPKDNTQNGVETVENTGKICEPGTWESLENGKIIIFTSKDVKASNKIASYDLDGTLIKTKSGNVFPKSISDWDLAYKNISTKLQMFYSNDYKICIFTNQGGIGTGKTKLEEFKHKIEMIIKRIDVPMQVFISAYYDYYRKPLPGLWLHMEEFRNDNIKIDKTMSFFVGDAAGRPQISSGANKRPKDHSLADRFFSKNIGITFYTPEEHFLGKPFEQWTQPQFNPIFDNINETLLDPPHAVLHNDACEMIMLVGLPGSGKTHFCKYYLDLNVYKHISADIMGNMTACMKACEEALKEGHHVVIDNTNIDVVSRKKFIDLARKYSVSCRCFLLATSNAQIKHNLVFRHLTNKEHSKITDVVFNTMKQKYTPPKEDEGFTEIVTVNLKLKFDDDDSRKLYRLYLVDR